MTDLNSVSHSYENKYNMYKDKIENVCIMYECFSDDLEEAIESNASNEYVDEMSLDEEESNLYGFFVPDRHDNLKSYDIDLDLKLNKKLKKKTYEGDVDCSGKHMKNDEYMQLMQKLNRKQYDLCTHIMHQLENNTDQMFIFLEGGAGVGKTCVGRAMCETITRHFQKQPGHIDNAERVLILAPTGMAAYHIKGTTLHTGLHIPINCEMLKPLSHSELNTLHSKFMHIKFKFIDEISMVGTMLFEKANRRAQEIFDCKKPFGGKHVIAVGDFYQMKLVWDTHIFKNSGTRYTPLAPNT